MTSLDEVTSLEQGQTCVPTIDSDSSEMRQIAMIIQPGELNQTNKAVYLIYKHKETSGKEQ